MVKFAFALWSKKFDSGSLWRSCPTPVIMSRLGAISTLLLMEVSILVITRRLQRRLNEGSSIHSSIGWRRRKRVFSQHIQHRLVRERKSDVLVVVQDNDSKGFLLVRHSVPPHPADLYIKK